MGDESFSFSSLLKPGQAMGMALQRELTSRREREQARKRRGYRYGGEADLVLAHGQAFTGRELPDQYEHLRGPVSRCHVNALDAVESDPELRYFTGFYMVGTLAQSHSWAVAPDGGVVEVTLWDTKAMEADGTPRSGWLFKSGPGGPSVPWLPPERWAYYGVEYDPAFVRAHSDERGLPVLAGSTPDPAHLSPPIYHPDEELPMFRRQYDPKGFVIAPMADNLAQELMGGDDDGDDWDEDDDEPRPEDQSFLP